MKFKLKFAKNETIVDNKFGDESFVTDLVGCGPLTLAAIGMFILTFFKLNLQNNHKVVLGAMSLTFGLFGISILYRSLMNKFKLSKKMIEVFFDESKLKDGNKEYKLSEKEIDFHHVTRRSGQYKVFEYINVGFYLNDATLYYNFDLDSFSELRSFINKYTNYKLINIKS